MTWSTLAALEDTLRARDIAVFPVICRPAAADQRIVLEEMERDDFSHVPVRADDGRVTHVHHRMELRASGAMACPRSFDSDRQSIDADGSLAGAIRLLADESFVLVRSKEAGTKDGIAGIINHADLLKAPVRVLVYTRSMRLEAATLQAVESREWERNPALRDEEHAARRRARLRVGATSLAGYLYLPELLRVGRSQEVLSVNDAEIDILRQARNFSAHAGNDLPADAENSETAAARVAMALKLIDRLLRQISNAHEGTS